MPPSYDGDGNAGSQDDKRNQIRNITDEIEFQEILFQSIDEDGGVENPEAAKKAIRDEIKDLRTQLEQLVNKDEPEASSSKSAGRKPLRRTNSPDDSGADKDPFSRNRRNNFYKNNELYAMSSDSEFENMNAGSIHLENNPKVNRGGLSRPKARKADLPQAPSFSSTASTPMSSVNSPTKMELPTRKRSISHLVATDQITHNKSRRTTPSPFPTRSATPMTGSSGDDAFDNTFFADAQHAANAKREQEKSDEELARKMQADLNASSPPAFGKPKSTYFHGTQSNARASSSWDQFWRTDSKSEPKFEQKMGQKSEMNGQSMNSIPKFGVPNNTNAYGMPGAFDPMPYEDDSDCEIIDSSAFRDNGRKANVKPEKIENKPEPNTLQKAIYGNMKVPTWMSSPSKPSDGNLPATGSIYSPQPFAPFDAKMPGAFPSGSMHDPANHLGYYAHGSGDIKQQDFSEEAYDSDAEIDDILRRNMENGRDMYGRPLDPRMRDQYNYIVNDPRKNDEEIRTLLSNIRPDEDLPKEDREGTPAGMAYPLYEHQKLALTWLKQQELGPNKGGILADDMGLGKTISTLALIVSRPSENRAKKTNLIVAPVALVRQWEREIKMKVKPAARLSVLNMHAKKKCTWDSIRAFDVVLTTYGTLGAEFKRLEKYELKKMNENEEPDQTEMNKLFPLFSLRSHFYRVILDEAQCIKNKGTVAARACFRLKATYRLVLTGTPMMNNAGELYSLVNFLRIKPYNEWTRWQDQFRVLSKPGGRGGDPQKALKKLQILLKAILLRRTKNSLIDGQPIINLPPKTEEIQHVLFDEDEQAFYNALETQTKLVFNKYMKAGTVGKNYSNVLVLLLRLRQACCHPHLIQDFETAPGAMDLDAMIELTKSLSEDVIARIRETEGNFECPICYDAVLNPSILIPCGHDICSECLSKVSDQAAADNQANDNQDASKCPTCRAVIDMKKVVDYSTFKKVHEQSEADIETASEHSDSEDSDADSDSDLDSDEEDSAEEVDSDGDLADFVVSDGVEDTEDEDEEVVEKPKAKDKGKELEAMEDFMDDPIEDDDSDVVTTISSTKSKVEKPKRKRTSKSKAKGKEKKTKKEHLSLAMLKTEANKSAKGRMKYMKYLKKHWQPSAKITKCVELLQQFQDDGQKTIIFSQFVSLLDLLQVPIEKNGWPVERYDGSMSAEARNNAIMRFTDRPSTKIMLISLKAGNSGLNLVAASRVIILDPFWNPFIELQAVDRAYRIGQQKSVEVHRILIETTVEDRIIELQRQKKEMVDAALDETASKSMGRLGVQQLAFLFNG